MRKSFSLDLASLPVLTVASLPRIRALVLVTLSQNTWQPVNTTANSVAKTVPLTPPSRCTIQDIIADSYDLKYFNKITIFPLNMRSLFRFA